MAVSGTVLSLILVLVLAGLPGSTPEQERTTLELTGKDLFEAIMEQNPVLRLNSRIATPAERGSADNLLVLPDATWQKLKVNERNSLGAWLNTLGRSWEIRVGVLSEDGSRVLDPQPVITSRAWNQQVK